MADISFRLCLGLLLWIHSWLYTAGQGGIIEKYALIGQQVNLTCQLNSSEDVTWLYKIGQKLFADIYTCKNGQCNPDDDVDIGGIVSRKFVNTEATQRNETFILSLTPSGEEEHDFQCKLGNDILQEYSVKSIDPSNIVPTCTVTLPSNNTNGLGCMTLSCEVNLDDIDVNLTLEGIGFNVHESPVSSLRMRAKTLYFDDFNIVRNASCKADFPGIDITPSCTYPNIIKAQCSVERNDIIVECDYSDENYWRFYGPDGREEDITNRSWSRKGGRSLLIRNISERDVGKVVVCRTKGDDNQTNNGTIGFHVISKIYGGTDNTNSEDLAPTPRPSAHNPYLVLMLLFLSLWLITTAVGGVWLGCTPKGGKSDTFAIASASGNASVPNGGSGERETPLVNVRTGARMDPGTLNTNNSAHNPDCEPEVNSADENNRNRQSNNESHLYFTLERSSPSPVNSLPRDSTARWEQPDVNLASLDHPQRESSHSQCYETVGEPNKGATCSYDLGEYAEVGYGKGPPVLGEYAEVGGHFQGKGPPHLLGRPSIRKKPARERDISSLYSKVNK